MTAARDPVRLHARLGRSSTLGRALEAAQAAGPDEKQLHALEQRVLACVGTAAVASTAVAVAAVAKAPVAGAATGLATGVSAGSVKLVLAALGVAAVTGGTTLVWQATRSVAARGTAPIAAPALVQAKAARGLPAAQPATQIAPTPPLPDMPLPPPAAQPQVRPIPVAPPRSRSMPAVAQPERRVLPPSPASPPPAPPAWSPPASQPAPTAPAAVSARTSNEAQPVRIGRPRTAEIDDEIPLIKRAHGALANDPALALSLAEEHTRRFPQSSLDQERELIAITAQVRLGRLGQARTQALHFANRHPDSAYNTQIRKMVHGEGN